MARIRDILPAVLSQRSEVIDQALATAMEHAQPEELQTLGKAMLTRGKAKGVESLIARFDRLPHEIQHTLVAQADQYATAIRRAAGRDNAESATNALAIIEQAASARMAYLATTLCRHSDPGVRQQAGHCLVTLAQRGASSPESDQPPHLDALSIRYLLEAIDQAVVLYSRHDQPAVLKAMLSLMPLSMPEARAALSQPEHSAVEALSTLLRTQPGQPGRHALFALVGVKPMGDACRDALAEAKMTDKLSEALATGHLLSLPSTRQGLRRVRQPDAVWPDAKQQAQMPDYARRWLPAYLQALTQDPQEQVVRLAPLARRTDKATRVAVMRRLIALAKPRTPDHQAAADNANDTLALMTRDADPAIARTALWHLIHADYAGLPRILADLVNSRHAAIRKVAAKRLAPLGFERFWNAWPKLDPKRRVAAGRALIKIDEDFHRHLGARLAMRDPDARLRALVIIATLNQGVFFEELLLELCTSEDHRIVASAVKALSGCTSEAAHQALQIAMDHEDTRIRANALEALSHTQASANLDKLIQMSQDPAQRPRANAIKALLELRAKDALPSLARMLSDKRSHHRISALWLIDELGILQLARIVAEMSLSDDNPDVKKRAGQVIQHLIDDLEHQADDHAHCSQTRDADHPTEAA